MTLIFVLFFFRFVRRKKCLFESNERVKKEVKVDRLEERKKKKKMNKCHVTFIAGERANPEQP